MEATTESVLDSIVREAILAVAGQCLLEERSKLLVEELTDQQTALLIRQEVTAWSYADSIAESLTDNFLSTLLGKVGSAEAAVEI